MPRGVKGSGKGGSTAPEAAAVGPGHNIQALDDDQRQILFDQHVTNYKNRLAAKKKSDADLKNACKLAKAELGKTAVMEIKLAIEFETEEGEGAIKDRLEATLRIARWVGSWIGTQAEMFGDGVDRTPAADRAYDEGKRAGRKGEPAKPPHSPETEQYRRWLDGHADGNEALAKSGLKPLSEGRDFAKAGDDFLEQQMRDRQKKIAGDAVDSLAPPLSSDEKVH